MKIEEVRSKKDAELSFDLNGLNKELHDLRFKAAQTVQLFSKPLQHLRLESDPILRGFHKIAADENLTDFPWDRQFCGALHFKGRYGAGGTPCPPEQGTENHSPASVLGKQTETSHRRVW